MTSTFNIRLPNQGISGPFSKASASSKTGAFEKRRTRNPPRSNSTAHPETQPPHSPGLHKHSTTGNRRGDRLTSLAVTKDHFGSTRAETKEDVPAGVDRGRYPIIGRITGDFHWKRGQAVSSRPTGRQWSDCLPTSPK